MKTPVRRHLAKLVLHRNNVTRHEGVSVVHAWLRAADPKESDRSCVRTTVHRWSQDLIPESIMLHARVHADLIRTHLKVRIPATSKNSRSHLETDGEIRCFPLCRTQKPHIVQRSTTNRPE